MPYGPKRLSMEQAVAIRQIYNAGQHTQKQVADLFNVSQALVCKIVNNQVHRSESRLGGEAIVRMGMKYGN